ncbi:MAG: hypothetical protein BGP06_03805 [Rhizobiales bacterium 65-9]|nr:hypothetical protein [Hyphomicrobiales bacterium]OJY36052.1 MAG: hypothetical protein BGP06_03805 [Rhizobiales bacterium 65-9]
MDFFYYGMEGLSQDQFKAMSQYWRRFFFLKSLALEPPSLPHAWGLDDWCPDHLCEQVAQVVAAHDYDAVIVNYVWMSKTFERLDGPLKILDTHDLFGGRNTIAERARLEPRWYFTTIEEENRGFARADVVIGIQERESTVIENRHKGRTITVGHPMDPQFLLRTRPKPPPSFTFGYIGSGNPFNVASLKALDQAIAPSSDVDWALAGTITRGRLSLQSCPYQMGLVDDLSDFYDHVACVLNPMIGGTGLKIKTIEALAYGKSIIGTLDAFEGIPARHPFHQLRTMRDMVDAMRHYKQSDVLQQEMQQESYRLFASYMARVSQEYDELARIICGDGSPRFSVAAA